MSGAVFRFVFEDDSSPSSAASRSGEPSGGQAGGAEAQRSPDRPPDDDIPPAPRRRAAAGENGSGDSNANDKDVIGAVRRVGQELSALPVVGRAFAAGNEFLDKLAPVLKESATIRPASGRAAAIASGLNTPMQAIVVQSPASTGPMGGPQNASGKAGGVLSNAVGGGVAAAQAGTAATGIAAKAAAGAPAVGAASGAASSIVAALGPIAVVGGATAIALNLVKEAAEAFAQRVEARTQDLEPFSPSIARARARNQVEEVRARIAAGRDYGEVFARVAAQRGEISRDLAAIADSVTAAVAEETEGMRKISEKVADVVAKNPEAVGFATKSAMTAAINSTGLGTVKVLLDIIAARLGEQVEESKAGGLDALAVYDAQSDMTLDSPTGIPSGIGRRGVSFAGTGGVELP